MFSRARCFLIMLIAAIPAAAPAQSELEGKPIREIVFTGLTASKPQQLENMIKSKVGQPYRALTIRDDLARLAREVRTASVDARILADGGVRIAFSVVESPVLGKIHIVGNKKIKTARIESLIDKKPGDKIDEDFLVRIRNSILNQYHTLGMPQADVRLDLIDVPGTGKAAQSADLQVLVNEGRQVKVEDVIIRGNKAFTATRLRMNMVTKGSFSFIKNYYDDPILDNDLVILRDFYKAHGYHDARIERGVFEEHNAGDEKATISPVIEIDEGRQYRFGAITVRGVHYWSQQAADAPFKGLTGEYYDAATLTRAIVKLQNLYFDHGYLTTSFRESEEPEPKSATLAITIAVTEGQKISVGKVRVVRPEYVPSTVKPNRFRRWWEKQTPPVKDEVIAREILLKPGDVYNKRLERDSVRRLARLDVFDTGDEKLRAYNKPTSDPDIHDMVVEIQEKDTGVASVGVGYGDATGPYVFGRLREMNYGGRADIIDSGMLLGTRDTSAWVRYFDRHFRGGPDSLQNSVFYQLLHRPGYDARTGGYNIELGHELDEDWRMYVRGRLEYVALSPARHVHAAEDLRRSYAVIAGRVGWIEDTRGPIGGLPTEGSLQSYAAELGYAGGPLARLETEQELYTKLTDFWTWRFDANAGLMPYDRETVPIHERYFLGGSQDMRGFSYRGAGYFDKKDRDVPIGGAAKLLVHNELMRPIFDPLTGVLFVDVGDLGRSPVSWQVPRVSTGAGLRFSMRQVIVAIDVAAPLVTQDQDKTQIFHFRISGEM